ncbi:MAG: phytanoyl-CoA dioxygenase family protein [Planctomycetaceae bacterium]|nr:phytanoyl-CoA dioxygenase family protein [Planctomycetaceae bacterium]
MKVPQLNQDPSQYDSLGYCVFRGVLDAGTVASVQQDLGKVLEAMPAKMMVYKDGQQVEADGRPEFLVEPHAHEGGDAWLELCCHPRVLDAVESILGPDLILIMSHLIVKRPTDGLPVAWHQDNTYWHSVQGTDVCTVWLAIDDADTDNGCMNVIPCTQANHPNMKKISTGGEDLLGTTVAVSQLQAGQAVPIELKAGDLSIHDSFIIHGSEANQSDRRRAGYTMRYANAATVAVDSDEHWVEVFRVRGNPHATEGYTDLRPGKRSR